MVGDEIEDMNIRSRVKVLVSPRGFWLVTPPSFRNINDEFLMFTFEIIELKVELRSYEEVSKK